MIKEQYDQDFTTSPIVIHTPATKSAFFLMIMSGIPRLLLYAYYLD